MVQELMEIVEVCSKDPYGMLYLEKSLMILITIDFISH